MGDQGLSWGEGKRLRERGTETQREGDGDLERGGQRPGEGMTEVREGVH